MQMMKLIKKLIGVLTLTADAYKDKNGDYWLLDITFNHNCRPNRYHYRRIEQNAFGFWELGIIEVTLNSPMSESPLA